MKSRWFITLFAVVPFVAATLSLESCAGVGGATKTDTGGLPSVTQAFLALLPTAQDGSTYVGNDGCSNGTCHTGRADGVDAHFSETKHAQKGVTCERCHGPGSKHAAEPTKDNILTFPKLTDPVVCAQCHGPLHEEYKASGHVGFISSPVISASTNPAGAKSSRCVMCHSGLFRTEVQSLGLDMATMTNDEIKKIADDTIASVPHVANCSTCHDPHSKTGKLDQNGQEKQLRRNVFNTDTTNIAPGTTAATFTNYDHVCAQCHNGRGTNPADASLTSGSSRPNMHDSNQFNMLMGLGGVEGSGPVDRNTAHATAPGQCTKCHMPDSRHSFTVSYDKGCAPCHTASDAAARAESIKSTILNDLYSLKEKMEAWALGRFGDADFWNYSSLVAEEGKTAPSQSLVPIEVKRARHNYYFIVRSGDYGVHNAPYAKSLIRVANDNMDALSAPAVLASKAPVSQAQKKASIENDRKLAHLADAKEDH